MASQSIVNTKSYAGVTPTTLFPKKDQAIIVDAIDNAHIKDYAQKRSANNPEKGKKSGKRKRDEDSTETELDSDVTYAETSESEENIISEDSSDDESKCTQVDNINKKLKTKQENKENMYRKKAKCVFVDCVCR
ncbi:hypothetical protein ACJJTC_012625 [Scirpophaga incertulas]